MPLKKIPTNKQKDNKKKSRFLEKAQPNTTNP